MKAKTETVTVEAKKVLRSKLGQYQKGTVGLSPGRPKLGLTTLDKLLQAIVRVENAKNKNLLDYYIERAFKNDAVLISVLKKLHPDLQAVAAVTVNKEMNDEMAESIRQTIIKRFETT